MRSSKSINIILPLYIFLSSLFIRCGAPNVEQEFLSDNYYDTVFKSKLRSDSTFSFKIDSLYKELYLLENDLRGLAKDKSKLDTTISKIRNQIETFKRSKDSIAQASKVKNDSISNQKISKSEPEVKQIPEEKKIEFESEYNRALSLFNSRKYKEAISTFHKLLISKDRVPDLIDNIYYWCAESYFAQRDYTNAIDYFSQVLNIENSNKSEDALMMLGNTYEKTGNLQMAKQSFERIVKEYPNGKYLDKAKIKLSNYK